MKNKNGVIYSEHGSVRYVEGVFYDQNYNEVFTPLTDGEFGKFITRVESAERKMHRVLSQVELASLVAG